MAQHMVDIFGDLLCDEDVDENRTALPSPEELKHKILIKVRRGRKEGGREEGRGGREGGRREEGRKEGGREGICRNVSITKVSVASSIFSSPPSPFPLSPVLSHFTGQEAEERT